MRGHKLSILFTGLLLLGMVASIHLPRAATVLIDITMTLTNVTSSTDKLPVGQGYGPAFISGGYAMSATGPDAIYGSFSHRVIQRFIESRRDRTIQGRTIAIDYEVTNIKFPPYDPEQTNSLHLFQFMWKDTVFDYAFRTNGEAKWSMGRLYPNMYFHDAPSKATIRDVGEVDVIMPGMNLSLFSTNKLWDIEAVNSGDNYRVIQTALWIKRPLFLVWRPADVGSYPKPGNMVGVRGTSSLGDTAIKTRIGSFWYPLDRYLLSFTFTTDYPAEVRMKFDGLNGLELKPAAALKFKTDQGKPYRGVMELTRDRPLLGLVLVVVPLIAGLLKDRPWRVFWYFVSVVVGLDKLSVPPDVPRFCAVNVV